MKPRSRCLRPARARPIWLVGLLMAAIAPITAAGVEPSAPGPIVERTVTIGQRHIRVSLFDNRVVVVSGRRDDEHTLFRQITLDEDEFVGYLAALQRDANELANGDRPSRVESTAGVGVITLHMGPDAPTEVRYSAIAVLDLVTARLVATLDDLEHRVIWGDPSAAELEGWDPQTGDRVELRNGTPAEVIEVREDGTLVLEHDDMWIIEVVPHGEWQTVILRVLQDEP